MITEDDPAVGGDHVDIHRTPLVMVSPWVKRGYVLHTHTTVSSLHKIIANVLAIPYPNVEVEHAAIPFDAFTNTPDFSAWTKKPRTYPLECGTAAPAAEHRLSTLWKGAGIDENHELDKQVERWLKHRPLASLTPLQEAAVRAHAAAVARGEVDERDDDD
jgi:phospholipase C